MLRERIYLNCGDEGFSKKKRLRNQILSLFLSGLVI